jgi:hypothetical protein
MVLLDVINRVSTGNKKAERYLTLGFFVAETKFSNYFLNGKAFTRRAI